MFIIGESMVRVFVDQTWLPLSKKHGTLGFCQTWPGKSSIYFDYFPTGWWFGTFFHILGTIIPFDFHIFQRGRSTTNQPSERNIWTPPLRGFPSVPRMAPEGNCLRCQTSGTIGGIWTIPIISHSPWLWLGIHDLHMAINKSAINAMKSPCSDD